MAAGPAALNSSRPTLATPNQGRRRAAHRIASTESSTSRASTRRWRTASGAPLLASREITGAEKT